MRAVDRRCRTENETPARQPDARQLPQDQHAQFGERRAAPRADRAASPLRRQRAARCRKTNLGCAESLSGAAPPQTRVNPVAFRLAAAQAASGLVGGAATPFFGAWLAWKGFSPAMIGALLSAGMFLRVAVVPLSGLAADARNDRRGVMLLLCLVMLAGYAALNFVSAPALLFAAAVPASVAAGASNPLLESVCVRLAGRFGFDYGHVRLWAS